MTCKIQVVDYFFIYTSLINRAKGRVLDSYTESHHILPKCMGGGNEKSNLVDLTPEEHFLAHQLLVKMYPNNHKLAYAATAMCMANKHHSLDRSRNKMYGWLRKRHAKAASKTHKGKIISSETKKKISEANKGASLKPETRKRMSEAAKGRIFSEETRLKMSESKKGEKNKLFGKSLSDEYRKKISKSMKGEKKSKDHSRKIGDGHKKAINQFSKDGQFIRQWASATDAAKILKINGCSISACVRGLTRSSCGFVWKLVEI